MKRFGLLAMGLEMELELELELENNHPLPACRSPSSYRNSRDLTAQYDKVNELLILSLISSEDIVLEVGR